MGILDIAVQKVRDIYSTIVNTLPEGLASGVNVFLFALAISFVAMFIWRFYRVLSKRDIITLNLAKYNKVEHPVVKKLLAISFYFVENIVVMPILISLWFAGLSLLILVVGSQASTIEHVLFLSASMIIAIRILAYHNSEVSIELAKLFPFISLSIFLLTPGIIGFGNFLDPIVKIPALFGSIVSSLIMIFFVELVLRLFYTIVEFWESEEEETK